MRYLLALILLVGLSALSAQSFSASVVRPSPSDPVPLTDLTMIRTALPFQRGSQLKTVMLVYNTFQWNLNGHLQLSTGLGGPLGVILGQRYRTSLNEWVHVGLSNEVLVIPWLAFIDDQLPFAGDLTTMLTIGDEYQFFHLGAGLYYTDAGGSVPNYRVGAGARLGGETHLYGELVTTTDPVGTITVLPSLNVSLARRRHRWSFGIFTVYVADQFGEGIPPLPYLSYSCYY